MMAKRQRVILRAPVAGLTGANCPQRVRRGFTLIELLVVIAIIALLVSILLPALSQAKKLAKLAVCQVNVRTLSTAHLQYATDNEEFINLVHEGSTSNGGIKQFNNVVGRNGQAVRGDGAPWGPLWQEDYLPGPEVLFCPLNTIRNYTWDAFKNDDTDGVYWFGTPNANKDNYMSVGYGVRPVKITRFEYGTNRCVLPVLTQLRGNEAIVSDFISTPMYARGHHYPRIHVGHLGGNVSTTDAEDFPAVWHAIPSDVYSASYNDIFLTDDGDAGIWVEMDGG